jgi:uncharacterized membrane protein
VGAGETYAWACIGGLVAAVAVHVLPLLTYATVRGDVAYARDRTELMTILVVVLTVIAGVVALVPDHLTRGQAIEYGLASQAILKGLATGAMEAFPFRARVA